MSSSSVRRQFRRFVRLIDMRRGISGNAQNENINRMRNEFRAVSAVV